MRHWIAWGLAGVLSVAVPCEGAADLILSCGDSGQVRTSAETPAEAPIPVSPQSQPENQCLVAGATGGNDVAWWIVGGVGIALLAGVGIYCLTHWPK